MSFIATMRNTGRLNGVLSSESKDSFEIHPPVEFGGRPGKWSPEDLLAGSVASCFELTLEYLLRRKKVVFETLIVSASLDLQKTAAGFRFSRADLDVQLNLNDESDGTFESIMEAVHLSQNSCPVTQALNLEEDVKVSINGAVRGVG